MEAITDELQRRGVLYCLCGVRGAGVAKNRHGHHNNPEMLVFPNRMGPTGHFWDMSTNGAVNRLETIALHIAAALRPAMQRAAPRPVQRRPQTAAPASIPAMSVPIVNLNEQQRQSIDGVTASLR